MNKMKLVPYALAFSLSATSLTSCGDSNFSYETVEGEFVADGTIDYNLLKNYKLIELELLNDENKLYIVSRTNSYDRFGEISYYYYTDIFSGEIIYNSELTQQLEIEKEFELIDYLVTYDEVKGSYSIEDIERIYNKILEDYEFESEKTLVNE